MAATAAGPLATRPGVTWQSYSCAVKVYSSVGNLVNEEGKLVTSDGVFPGRLWDDAAFVAERVLTADELKAFVDRQPLPQPKANQNEGDDPVVRLRYLLGRRLVREDRYKEAAQT